MGNSSRFFANKECEYYPCHECDHDINCLFCYCPLYDMDCPGDYSFIDKGGRIVKSCRGCTFPHEAGNYEAVVGMLRETFHRNFR